MLRSIIVLFLSIYCCHSASFGQGDNTNLLRSDEGVLDLQCFEVFLDSDNYIWIGSRAGLSKYDGRDIKSFNRSSGLIAENIFSVHEDSQKRKWLINLNGEPLYVENDIVHNRYTDPYLSELKTQNYKEQIFENSKGEIVFVSRDGLVQVLNGKEVKSYNLSQTEGLEYLFGLVEYENKYYALTKNGLLCLDRDFSTISQMVDWGETYTIRRRCLHKDRIYFSSTNTFCYVDLKTKEYKKVHVLDYSMVITDIRAIDDVVYICSTGGVFTYKDGEIKNYNEDITSPISAISIDDKGNEWYASLTRGVIQKPKLYVEPTNLCGLDNISYIDKKTDNIHIGTDDGEFYLSQDGNCENINVNVENLSFSINGSFFIDSTRWFFTSSHVFNEDKIGVKISNRGVLYSNEFDNVYIIFGEGVVVSKVEQMVNKPSNNFEPNHDFSKKKEVLPIYQCYAINDDSKGNVWVGAEEGLFIIQDKSYTKIEMPELNGSVVDLQIKDDIIFGLNYGVGVFVYDIDNESCFLLKEENGLISNKVTKIVIDLPSVFVAHSKGISEFEYRDNKLSVVRNFGVEHGMKIGKLDFLSVIDSSLIFGIDKKSYALDITNIASDTVEIFGDISTVEASSDEEIRIIFDCIDYNFGDRVNYEYKLSPIDTSWTKTNNESVVYRYLPPNDYRFEVRSVHPLRLPSVPYQVSFVVYDHWYQSKVTYFLSLVLLGFLVRFLIKIGVINFSKQRLYQWFLNKLRPRKFETIKIKDIKGGTQIVMLNEIEYLKASGNYVEYHITNNIITTRSTLKKSLDLLDNALNLQKVHRSYVVNLDKVTRINAKTLIINEKEIPFSATYRSVIDEHLGKSVG